MLTGSKDMYLLVEDKFGAFWAKAGLALVLGGAMATGTLAILACLYYANALAIQPLIAVFSGLTLTASENIVTAAIAFGINGVLIALLVYWLSRRWRKWEKGFVKWENEFIDDMNKFYGPRLVEIDNRLEHIESNAPDYEAAVANLKYLRGRVEALERHTDINGLRQLLADEISKREPGQSGSDPGD